MRKLSGLDYNLRDQRHRSLAVAPIEDVLEVRLAWHQAAGDVFVAGRSQMSLLNSSTAH